MLSYKTVNSNTLELLKKLMSVDLFHAMRLVGGTALALQYGHRNSIDLDFFGKLDASDDEILSVLNQYNDLEILKQSDKIKIYKINGIKVDFVSYDYPWLDNVVCEDGIRLASPKDIGAMKIYAAEGRGSRKDFIDIYYLLKRFSLEELLSLYKSKYPNHSEFVALRSLTYFSDAETYPMPLMFTDDNWETMKKEICNAVASYAKNQ